MRILLDCQSPPVGTVTFRMLVIELATVGSAAIAAAVAVVVLNAVFGVARAVGVVAARPRSTRAIICRGFRVSISFLSTLHRRTARGRRLFLSRISYTNS